MALSKITSGGTAFAGGGGGGDGGGGGAGGGGGGGLFGCPAATDVRFPDPELCRTVNNTPKNAHPAAERGVFHEGLAAVLSFVHEYPALSGRGDPDQAASEARAIAMRDNSLPGLSTRGAVFRVQNSLEYWSTLVKLTGYAKDLGVSNLADYGMRLAGALVVEADMERKFKPVAKMQNGDRNRTSLVTAERHKLCSVMLQYDGIGNTLWDNDGAFDLKPTSVSSLWDGFTELDDESERADDVRWVREVFAGGNESAKDDDDGDAGAIDDTDLTV